MSALCDTVMPPPAASRLRRAASRSPKAARRRPVAVVALVLLAAAALSSCGRLSDWSAVIDGNRLHARGLYQEAAASYLKVTPGRFGDVVRFDLANVYARLGEYAAAAELYAAVRKSGDPGISAAAWYNEGLALYEKGRYLEAWRAFRACLVLDPGDEDARHNLELSWRDWRKKDSAPPPAASASQRGESRDSDEELRLLRRFETGRFLPGGQAAQTPSPEDY